MQQLIVMLWVSLSLSDDSLVMKGEFLHMRCVGHIINLSLKDGLAEIDASIILQLGLLSHILDP